MKFDMRHGGAWDRGSADAYYRRAYRPHYFVGATGSSEEITEDRMTADELAAYRAGFDEQFSSGDFKDYS